jgi:hypothetical protein
VFINFIDPLIKGLSVWKIVYNEQNFPYLSARLGGLATVLGFFFLSSQEGYNLIRSGYYNHLGNKEMLIGNTLLGYEYYDQAAFLGVRTHYPNYKQGIRNLNVGNEYAAKNYFKTASYRFGSPYAYVNYGNLDKSLNPNKVQAQYEEALTRIQSDELRNNLGIIHFEKTNYAEALNHFASSESSNEWNKAPLINKWSVYQKTEQYAPEEVFKDYATNHYGVKANILSVYPFPDSLNFEFTNLNNAYVLHRRAYLLNSLYAFEHDSLERIVLEELENSTDADYNDRLRKGLAIHYYKKGEVNKAFKMLDYLQANSNRYYQGIYYDILGKLALDQEAYLLSLQFLDKAIALSHDSYLTKVEVLKAMDRMDELIKVLEIYIKKDPSRTQKANELIEKIPNYQPVAKSYPVIPLAQIDADSIYAIASKNAFNESLIEEAIKKFNEEGKDDLVYNLLVDAIEINPYSKTLLKAYIIAALEWNLIEYAENSLQQFKAIASESEFEMFLEVFNQKKYQQEQESW